MTRNAESIHRLRLLRLLPALLFAWCGCASKPVSDTAPSHFPPLPAEGARAANVFDQFMQADITPADGFDFPVGDGQGGGAYTDAATGKRHDGWHVATRFAENYSLGIHPGEDWNGPGGGDTDLGEPVYAVANGKVIFAAHCGKL